jgi:acetyltransferase-like isoleucine patch superfamily enzyme
MRLYWLSYAPKIAARLRGLGFRLLVLAAGGTCGAGVRLEGGLRLRAGFHSGIHFGKNAYIGRNCTFDIRLSAFLIVGDNITLTQGIFISACEAVYIGDDVLVGEYCSFRDANHSIENLALPINRQPMVARPIRISDNVWIGRGCAVLTGVSIGSGTVIGSNSVVTKDIAADTIAAGVPAKPVRTRKD